MSLGWSISLNHSPAILIGLLLLIVSAAKKSRTLIFKQEARRYSSDSTMESLRTWIPVAENWKYLSLRRPSRRTIAWDLSRAPLSWGSGKSWNVLDSSEFGTVSSRPAISAALRLTSVDSCFIWDAPSSFDGAKDSGSRSITNFPLRSTDCNSSGRASGQS